MATQLQKTGPQKANALTAFARNVGAASGSSATDPIMILDNKDGSETLGHWVFGQQRDELPDKFDALANRESLFIGHVCWKGGQIVDSIEAPMLDEQAVAELPGVDELPDHSPYKSKRDGWSAQMGGLLYLPDLEIQVQWRSPLNVGGSQLLERLGPVLLKGAGEHPEADPLLRFSVGSYYNKIQEKTTYTPQVAVVKWVPREQASLLS